MGFCADHNKCKAMLFELNKTNVNQGEISWILGLEVQNARDKLNYNSYRKTQNIKVVEDVLLRGYHFVWWKMVENWLRYSPFCAAIEMNGPHNKPASRARTTHLKEKLRWQSCRRGFCLHLYRFWWSWVKNPGQGTDSAARPPAAVWRERALHHKTPEMSNGEA